MWADSTESWYTYSFSFENATFSLRIRLPSTRILCNENGTFQQRSLELNFLKTLFSRVPVYRRERNFSKTLTTHYQVQSTPSNIRNLFKMADGRFPFLSFILGLISNLIACFQANSSSWLFQEAAEHDQITFATGVKRRKVGSPFSLTLAFMHFVLLMWSSASERPNPIPPQASAATPRLSW